jgi:hypothetical protein
MQIPLTQGKSAIIDEADYPLLSQSKWYAYKHGNTFYAARNSPRVTGKSYRIRMHTVIAGTPKGMDTDHINGDGLDNRRENLRVVTHRINTQIQHRIKTSKCLGVSWDKTHGKWRASIRFGGRYRHLIYSDIEEDAATTYRIANEVLLP